MIREAEPGVLTCQQCRGGLYTRDDVVSKQMSSVYILYLVKMWKGYLSKGHYFPTTLLSSQTAGILVFYDSCIK